MTLDADRLSLCLNNCKAEGSLSCRLLLELVAAHRTHVDPGDTSDRFCNPFF